METNFANPSCSARALALAICQAKQLEMPMYHFVRAWILEDIQKTPEEIADLLYRLMAPLEQQA